LSRDVTAISIYNRTTQRAVELALKFPTLKVFDDQAAFDSEKCPLLVVIPGLALLEMPRARIDRLKASRRVVVSCINGLPLSVLVRRFPSIPWVKAIPSVAAALGKSVTLVAKDSAVEDRDFSSVRRIFERVGVVFQTHDDEETDKLAVVTSCMPGLLCAILDEFAHTFELDEEQVSELLLDSALGSLALARRDSAGLKSLVSSVSNRGGLTEVGVSMIRVTFPSVFDQLRHVLDRKQQQRRQQYLAFD